tara:strand:- start:531 stop:752 length:222 start_codon:yes stop_codon:yes gene_type:complete
MQIDQKTIAARVEAGFNPALCNTLLCRAEVLKPGKQICVVEAEVFALNNGEKRLFSKTTVTLAVRPIAATLPR